MSGNIMFWEGREGGWGRGGSQRDGISKNVPQKPEPALVACLKIAKQARAMTTALLLVARADQGYKSMTQLLRAGPIGPSLLVESLVSVFD
jgi:hypothetical protein